jgi:hypothetical protein
MKDYRDDPHIKILAKDLSEKRIDRREFVHFATLLGISVEFRQTNSSR